MTAKAHAARVASRMKAKLKLLKFGEFAALPVCIVELMFWLTLVFRQSKQISRVLHVFWFFFPKSFRLFAMH